jgi:ElaB/YqjD/DUF883 family membrane-anchored ribosome-binding protein
MATSDNSESTKFDPAQLRSELHACATLHNAVGELNPRNSGLHNDLIQFAKKVMRRSLTWYTRPLHQFHAAVTRTLELLNSRLDLLETSWRQNVPAFLNAVSSVGALGHQIVRLRLELEAAHQELDQRLQSARELTRQEVESARQQMEQELQNARQQMEQELQNARQQMEQGLQKTNQEMDQGLQSVCELTQQEVESVRQQMEQELQKAHQEMDQGLQSVCQRTEQEFRDLRSNLQRTGESIAQSWRRIEFTRSEMLYEMKYGRRNSATVAARIEPKIVEPEKVAAAREFGLKLNLGCGQIPVEGYVNVDQRELPGVDVVADVADLPFEEGGVQEISSAHLLEHFPQEMLRRQLLPTWRALLTPGGVFKAVVPDGEAMLAATAAGSYSFSDFREVLFGAQDYDGDFHFNLFTPGSLCGLLEEAGFKDVRVNARARPNGKCFECEISAVKPSFTSESNTKSTGDISIDETGAGVIPSRAL